MGIEEERKAFLVTMGEYKMPLADAERINVDPNWHCGMKCECGHNFGFHFICVYHTPCNFPECKCPGYKYDPSK